MKMGNEQQAAIVRMCKHADAAAAADDDDDDDDDGGGDREHASISYLLL